MGRKGDLRANDALYHAPYNIAAAVDIGKATGIDPVPTGADGVAIINNVFFPLSRVAGDQPYQRPPMFIDVETLYGIKFLVYQSILIIDGEAAP